MIEDTHRNRLIVFARLLGISFYSLQKAFKEKDKRNLMRSFRKFKGRYSPEFYKKVKEISITLKLK